MPSISNNLGALIHIVVLVNILSKQIPFRKLLFHFFMFIRSQIDDNLIDLIIFLLEDLEFLNKIIDFFNPLNSLKFTQFATCKMIDKSMSTKLVSKNKIALTYLIILILRIALAFKYLHIQWEEDLRNDSRTFSWKVCHELDIFHSPLELKEYLTIILLWEILK